MSSKNLIKNLTQFKIEKGIPIPLHRNKFPWENMQVGDSFAFDPCLVKYQGLHSAARAQGMKVATRKDADGNMRCWRIA
jgi:hypothetical protein